MLLAGSVLALSARFARAGEDEGGAGVGEDEGGGWQIFEGRNCYEHKGGFRTSDVHNPILDHTLEECKELCEQVSECVGVLTIHRHSVEGNPPQGPCWLRGDVNPDECFQDVGADPWDLHVLQGRGVSAYAASILQSSFLSSSSSSSVFESPFHGFLFALLVLACCVLSFLVAKEHGLIPAARDGTRT